MTLGSAWAICMLVLYQAVLYHFYGILLVIHVEAG